MRKNQTVLSEVPHPFEGGEAYFIRTVTYHLVGRVKHVLRDFLVLEQASWAADSGRFTQAILKGTLNEVEPVGRAYVSLGSIVDAFPWAHPLPKEQR